MLTADTAGAHNSILTVAVRVLLAIFPKAAVLAAFMLSCFLAFVVGAQEISNPQEKCKSHPGLLALHCAAFSGNVVKVQRLLADKAQVNDDEDYTPLHWAAQGGNVDVIKTLIKADADLNAESWGYTPLHFAASAGNTEVVDALIAAGADMMVVSDDGETLLHSATRGGGIGLVEKLIKSGADINALDKDGNTPLHFVARSGKKVGVVEKLIDAGASVNVSNTHGRTPLHYAAAGSVGAVELLIAAGADVNSERYWEHGGRETPLHSAAYLGNKEIVIILVNAGAKITHRTWEWQKAGDEPTIGVNAIEIAERERGKYDPIAIFLREAAKARAQEMLEELE